MKRRCLQSGQAAAKPRQMHFLGYQSSRRRVGGGPRALKGVAQHFSPISGFQIFEQRGLRKSKIKTRNNRVKGVCRVRSEAILKFLKETFVS